MYSRVTRILGLTLVWLLTADKAGSQESQPTEYQVKAACLFNFAKFVDWPPTAFPQPASPIVIGIMGENLFHDDLARVVQGKTINNRPLVINEINSLSEATNCHILFISSSEKKRLREILPSLRNSSVLTVSETDHFTELGGMINFFAEGKKVHFEINVEAARNAGLKVSSRLLGLASRPPR